MLDQEKQNLVKTQLSALRKSMTLDEYKKYLKSGAQAFEKALAEYNDSYNESKLINQ